MPRKSKSTRCSTARSPATSTYPEDMAPGEIHSHARRPAGARSHRIRRCWPREQKMIERNDLASAPGAPRSLSGLHRLGRLLQSGLDASDVAVPRGFQTARVFRTKQNAGINEQAFAASEARHNYEATAVDHPIADPRRCTRGRDRAQADGSLPEVGDPGGATRAGVVHVRISDRLARFPLAVFQFHECGGLRSSCTTKSSCSSTWRWRGWKK